MLLTKSFAKSCNCSFANKGIQLDRSIYHDTVSGLGFNQALPVDFNYSQSKLTVDETVSEEDMIQISFGQGSVQMTPLHLHLITNAIANGGTYMKPMLLNKVETAEGELVKEFKPQAYKELMNYEYILIGGTSKRKIIAIFYCKYFGSFKKCCTFASAIERDSH